MSKISTFVKDNLYFLNDDEKEKVILFFKIPNGYKKLKKYFDCQNTNFSLEKIILAEQKLKKIRPTSSMYDVEYISYKYNISIEEANNKIIQFKKDKSTSKESFIKRHGEEKGILKFKEFQKTSASSSENMKNKLGSDKKWKEWCKNNSRRSKQYYISRGLATSDEEAKRMVSEYQLSTAGVNRQFYEDRKFSLEETEEILKAINKKKSNTPRNKKFLKHKYGDIWEEKYEEVMNTYRKRMEELGKWIPLDVLSEFKKYHSLCWLYTRRSVSISDLENLHLRSNDWHLDHLFSIKAGFIYNVSPKIIGSIVNLKIIPSIENLSKNSKCSISLLELLESYENYQNNSIKN